MATESFSRCNIYKYKYSRVLRSQKEIGDFPDYGNNIFKKICFTDMICQVKAFVNWSYGAMNKLCSAEFLRFYCITSSANVSSWQPMAAKVLQYHGDSPDKPRFLILAPCAVASIDVNDITIH